MKGSNNREGKDKEMGDIRDKEEKLMEDMKWQHVEVLGITKANTEGTKLKRILNRGYCMM